MDDRLARATRDTRMSDDKYVWVTPLDNSPVAHRFRQGEAKSACGFHWESRPFKVEDSAPGNACEECVAQARSAT